MLKINDWGTELHMNVDMTNESINAFIKMLDESDSDFLDNLFSGTEHLFLTRGSVTIELGVIKRVEHITEDDAKKAAQTLKDFCRAKGLNCNGCIFCDVDCNLYTEMPMNWPI